MNPTDKRRGDLQVATGGFVRTTWQRKNNRLPSDRYTGNNAYLVTSATWRRLPFFEDAELAESCVRELAVVTAIEQFTVLAYVFMPDHLHMLIQGEDNSDIARLMKRFKQQTSFDFKKRSGELLWQKSYHDRVLRREEDLNIVARYIAANPVRAGLAADWREYRYTGGSLLARGIAGDLKVAATSAEASR